MQHSKKFLFRFYCKNNCKSRNQKYVKSEFLDFRHFTRVFKSSLEFFKFICFEQAAFLIEKSSSENTLLHQKQLFWKVSQSSEESTCQRGLIKKLCRLLVLKTNSLTVVFQTTFPIFYQRAFVKAPLYSCF